MLCPLVLRGRRSASLPKFVKGIMAWFACPPPVAQGGFCDSHMQSHQFVSFKGGLRDTTKGLRIPNVSRLSLLLGRDGEVRGPASAPPPLSLRPRCFDDGAYPPRRCDARDLGYQALWPSCHAGHDGDHLKYQIISSSMRISRRDNGFTRSYSA